MTLLLAQVDCFSFALCFRIAQLAGEKPATHRAEPISYMSTYLTAKDLAIKYNDAISDAQVKIDKQNADLKDKFETGSISAQQALQCYMKPLPMANFKGNQKWARQWVYRMRRRLNLQGGATGRKVNTSGTYLQHDDPLSRT